MAEISKSKYFQSTQGVNKIDDAINFTQGKRFISHFGDGLCPDRKVSAEAAAAQQQARLTKRMCEERNAAGESRVRQAIETRAREIGHWRRQLNAEIDRLAKQYDANEESLRDLFRNVKYLSGVARVSQATADFRRNIEDVDPNDDIGKLLREEMRVNSTSSDSMQQHADQLNRNQRQVQATRNGLMSEVEAKGANLNIIKRCQHAEPLPGFPRAPADNLPSPSSEAEWEASVARRLEHSVSVRKEASDACCRASDAIAKAQTDTARAFHDSTKAVQESVQKTEWAVFNVKDTLSSVVKSLSASEQRVDSFRNDLEMKGRLQALERWRLQMLAYRPAGENIRDGLVQKLEDELREIGKRDLFVSENVGQNKRLIQKLVAQLEEKTLELERLSRKLFIEQEHCLGIRRSILIEGMNSYNHD